MNCQITPFTFEGTVHNSASNSGCAVILWTLVHHRYFCLRYGPLGEFLELSEQSMFRCGCDMSLLNVQSGVQFDLSFLFSGFLGTNCILPDFRRVKHFDIRIWSRILDSALTSA